MLYVNVQVHVLWFWSDMLLYCTQVQVPIKWYFSNLCWKFCYFVKEGCMKWVIFLGENVEILNISPAGWEAYKIIWLALNILYIFSILIWDVLCMNFHCPLGIFQCPQFCTVFCRKYCPVLLIDSNQFKIDITPSLFWVIVSISRCCYIVSADLVVYKVTN